MKIVSHVIACCIGAALAWGVVAYRDAARSRQQSLNELAQARAGVARRCSELYSRLNGHLGGCAAAAASDRDFAMKLLVDQEKNAPEITEFAAKYLRPAGLSLLEIADSSWTVLSSGHFPANAGNLIADKARLPEGTAEFLSDRVRGEQLLTLQETVSFKIADAVLHCLGGWIVDEEFVRQLAPCDGIRVIVRLGGIVIAPQKVESISEFRDHAIVVNNRRYAADTLSLPGGASVDARPVLIVLVEEKPPRP